MQKLKRVKISFLMLVSFAFAGCNNRPEKATEKTDAAITDTTSGSENKVANVHSAASPELYNEIAHMDSVLFDAFNAHNLEKLETTFSPELEFYHDKGGLTDYKQTVENFKSLFEKNKNTGLRRDLVKNSLEVYPIKDFGAIEIGIHKFCHVENGANDCGTFKFVHIWKKKNGQWKVTRIISYDH